MSDASKVVWSEGMFLRQHHFQQQDRHFDWLFRSVLMASNNPAWGFHTLVLDEEALYQGRLAIVRATGIFPDGTPFAIPEQTPCPEPVSLTPASGAGLAALTIPAVLEAGVRVDRAGEPSSGARFAGREISARDLNRGGGSAEDVEVADLVCRIDPPGEDVDRRISLPFARVQSIASTGSIRLDAAFVPPALAIGAVPFLGQLLSELIAGLEAAVEVHAKVVQGRTAGSYDSLLKLDVVNSALGRLRHLRGQGTEHPASLYGYLAELAGRLATYAAADFRIRALPEYVHGAAQESFDRLATTLRPLVDGIAHHEPQWRHLPMTQKSGNIWTIHVDNPELLRKARVILRVMSEQSDDLVERIFSEDTTVGGAEQFESLWARRVRGVPLKVMRMHPRDIPYDGDSVCLEFDQSDEHWPDAARPPGFVLGVVGDLAGAPRLDCYAVKR